MIQTVGVYYNNIVIVGLLVVVFTSATLSPHVGGDIAGGGSIVKRSMPNAVEMYSCVSATEPFCYPKGIFKIWSSRLLLLIERYL